jgi:exonuclease VII small subunit
VEVGPLVQCLEDLQEELRRWSSTASEAIRAAEHVQRQGREAVQHMVHRAAIVIDQALQDQHDHDSLAAGVRELLERCTGAKQQSLATRAQADSLLDEARSTLTHWEEELAAALAWLSRAEHRLEAALEDLHRAQSELQTAEWALESAVDSYNRCINAKERRDCSGQRARVVEAQTRVHAARSYIMQAEAEAEAARHEVAMARARVACCRNAVGFAQQAVHGAESATANAEHAVNATERALEFALASQRFLDSAQQQVDMEKLAADETLTRAQQASACAEEALFYYINAERNETEGQRHATGGRYRLSEKVDILRKFDTGSVVFK